MPDAPPGAAPPFVHEIRVSWADCDPALIAYTGRIPNFALEAIDAWWEHHVGVDWYRLNLDRKFGTPFVNLNLSFRSPVTPRHRLRCEVVLRKLGNSSICHEVRGFQGATLCFDGEFVSVFVQADSLQPRRPPEEILNILLRLERPAAQVPVSEAAP